MNFYPKSFAVRMLICVLGAIAGTNLGLFIKQVVINHGAFVFQVMQGLILPAAIGALAGFCWKQREQ